MQSVSFREAVDELTRSDARYQPDAYQFVRDALEFTLRRRRKNDPQQTGDIPAFELLDGMRLYALKEFGPMAVCVFDYWGVRSTEDFGNLVFNLVDMGVFSKTENDRIEDFKNAYRFDDAFAAPFRPLKNKSSKPAPGTVGTCA